MSLTLASVPSYRNFLNALTPSANGLCLGAKPFFGVESAQRIPSMSSLRAIVQGLRTPEVREAFGATREVSRLKSEFLTIPTDKGRVELIYRDVVNGGAVNGIGCEQIDIAVFRRVSKVMTLGVRHVFNMKNADFLLPTEYHFLLALPHGVDDALTSEEYGLASPNGPLRQLVDVYADTCGFKDKKSFMVNVKQDGPVILSAVDQWGAQVDYQLNDSQRFFEATDIDEEHDSRDGRIYYLTGLKFVLIGPNTPLQGGEHILWESLERSIGHRLPGMPSGLL